MKQFKNILLLHPCDKPTLSRAVRLAEQNGAQLTVLRPVRERISASLITEPGAPLYDLHALVVNECQSELDDFVSASHFNSERITTKVAVGTPFLEIIRDVIDQQRDLVMMTAEGTGGLANRLFGSTSQHLMRKCPCPVWVMKSGSQAAYQCILAAVDPDPSDERRNELNHEILRLASELAEQENAALHIAHAWSLYGEDALRASGQIPESELAEMLHAEESKHQHMLDQLLVNEALNDATVHILKGEAEAVIPPTAAKIAADLLVMGTVCRTGIPGFFIGNTAEKILDDVDCSVLTVKPEGFQTPVRLP